MLSLDASGLQFYQWSLLPHSVKCYHNVKSIHHNLHPLLVNQGCNVVWNKVVRKTQSGHQYVGMDGLLMHDNSTVSVVFHHLTFDWIRLIGWLIIKLGRVVRIIKGSLSIDANKFPSKFSAFNLLSSNSEEQFKQISCIYGFHVLF